MNHSTPSAATPESTAPAADPWIGRVIADEFELVAPLGAGVQGAVYRAIRRPSGQTVAVKILAGAKADDRQGRLRFLREARALELLSSHPGVVGFLRFGTLRGVADGSKSGGLYLAETLAEGTPLRSVLCGGPLAPLRAVRIARQVLAILDETHRQGVAHRDIKPAHIMLAQDGEGRETVTLIDFGLVRREHGFDAADRPLTAVGCVLGSPSYMAPEPLRQAPAGPPADQYSLGVVLFEMLAGHPPFSGSARAQLVAHAFDPVPALPASVDPTGALTRIIRRAMAKDPAARFAAPASMSDALAVLEPMLDDEGATVVEAPSAALEALLAAHRARKPAARRPESAHGARASARLGYGRPRPRMPRWATVAAVTCAGLVFGSAAAATMIL